MAAQHVRSRRASARARWGWSSIFRRPRSVVSSLPPIYCREPPESFVIRPGSARFRCFLGPDQRIRIITRSRFSVSLVDEFREPRADFRMETATPAFVDERDVGQIQRTDLVLEPEGCQLHAHQGVQVGHGEVRPRLGLVDFRGWQRVILRSAQSVTVRGMEQRQDPKARIGPALFDRPWPETGRSGSDPPVGPRSPAAPRAGGPQDAGSRHAGAAGQRRRRWRATIPPRTEPRRRLRRMRAGRCLLARAVNRRDRRRIPVSYPVDQHDPRHRVAHRDATTQEKGPGP